jgi:hypothetical protein
MASKKAIDRAFCEKMVTIHDMYDYEKDRPFHRGLEYSRKEIFEIIENHEKYGYDPGYIQERPTKKGMKPNYGTSLLYACRSLRRHLALALLKTGKSRPDITGLGDNTALMLACSFKKSDVALAIIATGKSRPDHASDHYGTALIESIRSKKFRVALAIIATGKSRPEYSSENENRTALIYICAKLYDGSFYFEDDSEEEEDDSDLLFDDVVMALIKTGKSLPNYKYDGKTAIEHLIAHKKYDLVYYVRCELAWQRRQYVL